MSQIPDNLFFLGIKGVAMANLAVIFKKAGKRVDGVDVDEEFITDKLLSKYAITYTAGPNKTWKLPKSTECVVYSAAHQGNNNPLAKEAYEKGLKVVSQVEIIGQLMKDFGTTIAVSGCHGKTTTSSLLAYALIKLGKQPSYLVGAPFFNEYDGGDYNNKDYFVVEADEYGVNPPDDKKPKLLYLNPQYIICTNIDYDHPDVYKDLEDTKNTFKQFFKGKKLVICQDDANLRDVTSDFPKEKYVTYGFGKDCDYRIEDAKYTGPVSAFELFYRNESLGLFSVPLFGDKNISNTAAVIAQLHELGYAPGAINLAIQGFVGARRRFEFVFEINKIRLFDDYAHHPTEIITTIQAARKHFPNKRIIVIFQPHTYSRTQNLQTEFAKALAFSDYAFILPIFASAREDSHTFTVSSNDIAETIHSSRHSAVNSIEELKKKLEPVIEPGDIVFTMGAGDVYKLKDDIIKIINQI